MMADADISKELLKIFEGLLGSCCKHYQLLMKEDQLKALKIIKNTALRFELKQEGGGRGVKEEYFEPDDTSVENFDDMVPMYHVNPSSNYSFEIGQFSHM